MKDERDSEPIVILTPSAWHAPPELTGERCAPAYTELLMEVFLPPAHLAHAGDRHVTMEAKP